MTTIHKAACAVFMAGFVVVLAGAPAFAQQSTIGAATLNLEGKAASQVAVALGTSATAHNVVGGITTGGMLSIADKANITTKASATSQVAVALGSKSSAGNNVGGVLAMGTLTTR